jgi:hypothetical protein
MARTTNQTSTNGSRYTKLRAKYYPFFWFIAAADETILRRCSMTEQDKQAGIGLTILFTAIAAILSGFFAFHLIFHNWAIALPIAIFWGLIIFNLDRFMVGTLKKDSNGRIWKELLVASPRILLAFLIAILISKPIEVKILENQIDAKSVFLIEKGRDSIASTRVQEMNSELALRTNLAQEKAAMEQLQNQCSGAPGWESLNTEYQSCMVNYNQIARQRDLKKGERSALSRNQTYIVLVRKDLNNDGSFSDNEFVEQLSEEGVQERNRLSSEINDLDRRMSQLGCSEKRNQRDAACASFQKQLGAKIVENSSRIGKIDTAVEKKGEDIAVLKKKTEKQLETASADIFGKLSTLEELKKGDPSMYWASWLITLLFFILETAPLLVKILAKRGEYDSRLRVAEELVFNEETEEIEKSRIETEARIQASTENGTQLTASEQEMNRQTMERIMAAQSKLTDQIVTAWVDSESEQLANDRDSYLRDRISTAN